MRLHRPSRDDRGVSVVIGTVLLVGIVTMVMAVLGAAILGTGFVDQPPRAEFVYQENDDGTVAIALADVQRLTAGDTEIKLEGEGSCGTWDGSGDLEKGAVTTVDGGDCPESLEVGDVLQIIGSETLLDTYELRGVSTDGFVDCDDKIEGGKLIVENETLRCDIGSDTERSDIEVVVKNGGELVGQVNTSENVEITDGRIEGDVNTEDPSGFSETNTDWEIEGDVTIPSGGTDTDLSIEGDGLIDGSISFVNSEQSITIKKDHDVTGDVTITASDSGLTLKENATIGGIVDANDNDISLDGDSAEIEGELVSGEVTKCADNTKINGEDCEEHKD